MTRTRFAILGAGSWGTALALYLAKLGHDINLWSNEEPHIQELKTERQNRRYLPGLPFPQNIEIFSLLDQAVANTDIVLIAVPSVGFKDVISKIKPLITPTTKLLWATKGLEATSGDLLHKTADNILGPDVKKAILSGPSFAVEVANDLPTAVVIASRDSDYAKELAALFNSDHLRVYHSTDIIGVQICGAVKNVLAIASGISDGMQFGSNARSALITRGLSEMIRLGLKIGGKIETFIGLAGVGDLFLTCTDVKSRNYRFGHAVGTGKSIKDALSTIDQVVEGINTAHQVAKLARKNSIDMPITDMVCMVLDNEISPNDAFKSLLTRTQKSEGIR